MIRPAYRRVRNGVLDGLHRSSFFRRVRQATPESLSVIVYHRVGDPKGPGFFGFPKNVSVSQEEFGKQIRYLRDNFDVVSIDNCIDWVKRKGVLPKKAVLVTFDDGYRDNLLAAAPILRLYAVRPVLFVATGFVDDRQVFYWDWVWEAFQRTARTRAILPLLGQRDLGQPVAAAQAAEHWIAASKKVSETEKKAAIAQLALALEVPEPATPPRGTQLGWEEIIALSRDCFDIGCHTANHPILSRVPIRVATEELASSRALLEQALSRSVRSVAYPNGLSADFGCEHEELAEQLGFEIGFAGFGGVTFAREARRRPFAIRRTCIGMRDTLPVFAAKVAGFERLNPHH